MARTFFEENRGQSRRGVRYLLRTGGGNVLIEDSGWTIAVPGVPSTAYPNIKLLGATTASRAEGRRGLSTRVHYMSGRRNQASARTYQKVVVPKVYRGIDAVFEATDNGLESRFAVGPSAEPDQIRLRFSHADNLRITSSGRISFTAGGEKLLLEKPHVYQSTGDQHQGVPATYQLAADDVVTYRIGRYNRSKTLIVDPVLRYSTLLGGAARDETRSVAVGADGSMYVVGHTASAGLGTEGAFDPSKNGKTDVFVSKLAPSGSRIVYTTYLGGRGLDYGNDLDVTRRGNVTVTGRTFSNDFPTTRAALKQRRAGSDTGDGFVSRLSRDGSRLVYSTFLGGSGHENPSAIDVANGLATVAGVTGSRNFPTVRASQPALAGLTDAFVATLSRDGSSLRHSTYLGGEGLDQAGGVVLDDSRAAYVTGGTTSKVFPTKDAFQVAPGSQSAEAFAVDAFVTKFNADGSIAYSSFLGGQGRDYGRGIAIDESGDVYVAGETASTDLPGAASSHRPLGGRLDAFVTRVSGTGDAVRYSQYLGGRSDDGAYGLSIGDNAAYIVGKTKSPNFPTLHAFQAKKRPETDAFATSVHTGDGAMRYSTYLGGRQVDSASGAQVFKGSLYIAGTTRSFNFPQTVDVKPKTERRTNGFIAIVGPRR